MTELVFHCADQQFGEDHVIKFNPKTDYYSCSCISFQTHQYCSHIDATLVAGERAMISPPERPIADQIMNLVTGKIKIPSDWRAAWRRNFPWRGLGNHHENTSLNTHCPTVCFTGKDPSNPAKTRDEYMREAEAKGFRTLRAISGTVTVVVAEKPTLRTNKLRGALALGIPILSYEEWSHFTADGEFVDNVDDIPKLDIKPLSSKRQKLSHSASFACRSRSSEKPHIISYDSSTGKISCDCDCFQKEGFCAHIDATILENELNLVNPSDWNTVSDIAYTAKKFIRVPENWKANWKRNLKWLDRRKHEKGELFKPRSTTEEDDGRPTVVLLGRGFQYQNRTAFGRVMDVDAKGFRLLLRPTFNVDVIVSNPEDDEYQEKREMARMRRIPVLTYEEWEDFTVFGENIPD